MGANRRFAAVKYTLFMLVGGVPLLFAFILLAFNHADVSGLASPPGSASTTRPCSAHPCQTAWSSWSSCLLVLGFAVKTPVFPLHTWLPVVAAEGPVAIAALMTGLKLGAFGLIRFVVPLAPGPRRSSTGCCRGWG